MTKREWIERLARETRCVNYYDELVIPIEIVADLLSKKDERIVSLEKEVEFARKFPRYRDNYL